MSDLLLWLDILIIAFCLSGPFFCSLAEAALLGMNEVRQRRLQELHDPRVPVVMQLLSGGEYLSTLIVGMNFFVLLISTLTTLLVNEWLHRGGLGEGRPWLEESLHLGMVLFIVVFAELTPKTYGSLFPERVSLRVARPLRVLLLIFRPVALLLTRLSAPLVKLLAHPERHEHFLSLDEIRAAADVSEEEGLVDADEAEMLDSVMDLGETLAREIMVPRVDIAAVAQDASVEELAQLAAQSGYSRLPIYEETLDSITGIVHINDVLARLGAGEHAFRLTELARPPFYVPETKRIDDLFHELREQRIHLAIVVDEFGGTAGLVTIEDILEELVGEIEDEHDRPSDEISQLGPDEAVVEGKVRIEEVNELLNCQLPDDDYETIAGLVSGMAGHIPTVGEKYETRGTELVVEESDGQHVQRIRIVVRSREDGDV